MHFFLLSSRRSPCVGPAPQSLVLAPLFVHFELLFALGYRRRLHAEVQALVLANIEEWKKHHQPLLAQTGGDKQGE